MHVLLMLLQLLRRLLYVMVLLPRGTLVRGAQLRVSRLLQLRPAAAGACSRLQHATPRPPLLLLHHQLLLLLVRAAASTATEQRQLTCTNRIATVAATSPATRAPCNCTRCKCIRHILLLLLQHGCNIAYKIQQLP
jgi:hypothetical protein